MTTVGHHAPVIGPRMGNLRQRCYRCLKLTTAWQSCVRGGRRGARDRKVAGDRTVTAAVSYSLEPGLMCRNQPNGPQTARPECSSHI